MARDSWGENLQCPHCRKTGEARLSATDVPDQHPRQIDPIILSILASSRSMAGLVPRSGPFSGPLPTLFDESAVPNELVPGAAALVPKAPPVTGMPPATDVWCDPM